MEVFSRKLLPNRSLRRDSQESLQGILGTSAGVPSQQLSRETACLCARLRNGFRATTIFGCFVRSSAALVFLSAAAASSVVVLAGGVLLPVLPAVVAVAAHAAAVVAATAADAVGGFAVV